MSLNVDIHKCYKSFSLHIKFDTDSGAIGLLGASGCGKSLTLKCIAGIEKPDRGRIEHNGIVLFDSELGINLEPRQRKIGFMFQNYALFPNMTVRKNIEISVRDKKMKKKVADSMMERFCIHELQNRYPSQLSGGEQQRVALARIMANNPIMIMLDEPFSALDLYLREQLQFELMDMLQDFPGDVIMVSHSRDELYRFSKNIAVLDQGRVIQIGDKSELYSNPVDTITAKLTGCKNISRATKISDYEVIALDWDIRLKVANLVEEDICYVGIQAHNIKPVDKMSGTNTISVGLAALQEGPYDYNFILYNTESTSKGEKLCWVVSKQDWWEVHQGQLPTNISLPEEHILLLKK